MSEEVINKVDKSALDKIRRLIEQEIKESQKNNTLNLTEIFKSGTEISSERSVNENIQDYKEIKKNIRSQIQLILKNELKKSLTTSFEEIIKPLLKKYLKSTGNEDENTEKGIHTQEKNIENSKSKKNNLKLKTKKAQNIFNSKTLAKDQKEKKLEETNKKLENMTKSELKNIGKKYNLNLDLRRKKETLIIQIKRFLEKK